jgi:two-component system OmpR family response regulator
VRHVGTAAEALETAAAAPFDAIVLDRTLPDGDGLAIVPRLRVLEVATPVVVLSALAETAHKLEGFRHDVDDYLGKPFSVEELAARIVAVCRRAKRSPHPSVLVLGELEIWLKAGSAVRAGRRLDLSDTELKLLILLAENEGVLVTRRMILEKVFGYRVGVDPGTNVVEVGMSRLRAKLDRGFAHPMLETVRQQGYLLHARADPD